MPAKTARVNGSVPGLLSGTIDLDALLFERRLEPVPVVLGGHTYQVRRDLRASEINAFWDFLGQTKDVDAFAILLGEEDSARFNEVTEELPNEHRILVVQKFVVAAKLRKEEDFTDGEAVEMGESRAS